MDYSKLITEIDGEIEKLQRAKDALTSINHLEPEKRAYHRSPKPVHRRLTPAGRKRLSDMMKKRWADRKKKHKNSL